MSKRLRDNSANNSFNEHQEQPPGKKLRHVIMVPPVNEDTVGSGWHIVRIVPDSDEKLLFSTKHGDMLKASVDKVIAAEMDPEIKFEWTGPERRRYKMVCPNTKVRDWALAIVPKLTGLWENPQIKAIDCGIAPKLFRSSIIFQDKAPNMVDLFESIDLKNENIDTLNWRIYGRQVKTQGQKEKITVFLGIDEQSIAELRKIGCRPYALNGRTKINVLENPNES